MLRWGFPRFPGPAGVGGTLPTLFDTYRGHLLDILKTLEGEGALPAGLDFRNVAVEPPRDASHGDLATNAAMVLAKPAGQNPRALAGLLAPRQIGRASCRERECPYVWIPGVAGSSKKK